MCSPTRRCSRRSWWASPISPARASRRKARGWQRELWNWLFWAGSFLAAFAQGLMLGRYITGFQPGFGYWLFSLVVAGGVCGGYVLLGATWLVLKSEGALQQKAIAWSRWG